MISTRLRAVKVDENEVQHKSKKIVQVAKGSATSNALVQKRAALGELGNRAVVRSKDGQKDNILIKNAKARVDTHWKKTEVTSSTNNSAEDRVKKATVQLKTTTETTKIRLVKPKTTLTKTSTLTQSSTNLQQVGVQPIRREESNVSRRSLSKVKAVFCKDKKEKATGVVAPVSKQHHPLVGIVPPTIVQAADSTTEKTKAIEVKCRTKAHSSALLEEVVNIDSGDNENPFLVSEYANDIYSYLFQLEYQMSVRKAHLDAQAEVTPKMRAVLYDWINEVHFQFRLLPETYHLTIGIIDRYLQKVNDIQRKHLQLVGIGALFLASKYEELYPPDIADFVYIADNTYSRNEILAIEQKIIKALDFNMGRPSSIHFLRRFSKAANTIDIVHILAKYLIELVSIEYTLAHHRPSEVAAASLLLSLKLFNKDPSKTDDVLWSNTLKFYTTYTTESLRPLLKRIATLVKNAPTGHLKAVYNKYNSSKFEKIALKSELNGSVLDKIIAE